MVGKAGRDKLAQKIVDFWRHYPEYEKSLETALVCLDHEGHLVI